MADQDRLGDERGGRAPAVASVVSDGTAVGRRIRLAYRLQYLLFRGAVGLFAALPRRTALRLGAGLGELFYHLGRRLRRIGLFNLAIAFPERSIGERQRILRASCHNLGRLAAEFCHLPALTAEGLSDIVSFADRAAWERTVAGAGHTGGIVVTGHFGNWELLAYVHGLLGHPVTLIHRPMRNELVDAAVNAVRWRAGTRTLAKKAAAREAIRTLRQRGILVIPCDQNQTRRFGVFVDVFGKPASTTPGAARLAMRTGAPACPVFLVREPDGEHHRVEVGSPIAMVDTGDREADIVTNTQRCSDAVEAMIRRYPEQWVWFHKRWRTRPKGEPRIYV